MAVTVTPFVTPSVYLAGTITARSGGRGPSIPQPINLAGRITAKSVGGAVTVPQPALFGRITAMGFSGGRMQPYLIGRITAQGKIRGQFPPYLIGRVKATSSGQANWPVFSTPPQLLRMLHGTISGVGHIQIRPPLFTTVFAGTITARSSGFTYLPLFPTAALVSLSGRISSISKGRIHHPKLSPDPKSLYGSIKGTSELWLDTEPGYYHISLTGRIQGASHIWSTVGPWQPNLRGIITAAARLRFANSEIVIPLPPYPPPFPTHTTLDYLDRITSEHNQKPRYVDTVGYSLDPEVQDAQLVAGLLGLFDLDYCIGEQEDFTGQWVGKSRWIEIPGVFFTWDEEGAGWNQANWKGPADADHALQRLDDYHYRLLLYAAIISNHWNGSIPAAYEAWDTLFRFTGIHVIIQDYGNMTMLYGVVSDGKLDLVLLSLLLIGELDLRPEGVQLIAYALQQKPGIPFFAWDAASDAVHGWDTGQWAIMVPPGEIPPPLLPD